MHTILEQVSNVKETQRGWLGGASPLPRLRAAGAHWKRHAQTTTRCCKTYPTTWWHSSNTSTVKSSIRINPWRNASSSV